MKVISTLLLFVAVAVLVEGAPQDLAFPSESEERPQLSPSQGIDPTAQIPGRQSTTQFQPSETSTATPASPSNTTTRIPPRDPGNRIVYTLPCTIKCPFTNQYSPVCGTDGQTYGNIGVLDCTRKCGKQVDVYLVGACGRNNG